MNTAQLVIGGYQRTQERTTLAPWLIGGIVVIVALYFIANLKR